MKKVAVKKLEVSDGLSNLAVFTAVVLVSLPMLLGDQLGIVASNFLNEGASMIQGFADFLIGSFR